jgi:RNA recognition motif-containing protein
MEPPPRQVDSRRRNEKGLGIGMTTIYVGNLPVDAAEDALRALFSPFGCVASVAVVRAGSSLKPRDYGLVEMPDLEGAERAAQNLNGQYFHGKLLHVESYEPARRRVSNL